MSGPSPLTVSTGLLGSPSIRMFPFLQFNGVITDRWHHTSLRETDLHILQKDFHSKFSFQCSVGDSKKQLGFQNTALVGGDEA